MCQAEADTVRLKKEIKDQEYRVQRIKELIAIERSKQDSIDQLRVIRGMVDDEIVRAAIQRNRVKRLVDTAKDK